MSSIPTSFSAFVAQKDGDAVVRVAWSGANYKVGLATVANGKVARIDPIISGVDLAGANTGRTLVRL